MVTLIWSSQVPGWRSPFSGMKKAEAQRVWETLRGHQPRSWQELGEDSDGQKQSLSCGHYTKLEERHGAVLFAERLNACLVWACLVWTAVASPLPYLGWQLGSPAPPSASASGSCPRPHVLQGSDQCPNLTKLLIMAPPRSAQTQPPRMPHYEGVF